MSLPYVPSVCAPSIFLYRSAHHRDLPSFPTRRSSDLKPVPDSGTVGNCRAECARCARAEPRTRRAHSARQRSEEHTSELQSHHDLVCRLLLEKKKKKTSGQDL